MALPAGARPFVRTPNAARSYYRDYIQVHVDWSLTFIATAGSISVDGVAVTDSGFHKGLLHPYDSPSVVVTNVVPGGFYANIPYKTIERV